MEIIVNRRVGAVLGIVVIAVGAIWVLQGIGVLPGSVMSGVSLWAYIGGALIVVGLIALALVSRRSRPR